MTEIMEDAGRLLIVDDEVTAVENLAHVCRKEGYEVTALTSGVAAIEALEAKRFDVVLTDLKMEKVDGMAVLRRAKELDADMLQEADRRMYQAKQSGRNTVCC